MLFERLERPTKKWKFTGKLNKYRKYSYHVVRHSCFYWKIDTRTRIGKEHAPVSWPLWICGTMATIIVANRIESTTPKHILTVTVDGPQVHRPWTKARFVFNSVRMKLWFHFFRVITWNILNSEDMGSVFANDFTFFLYDCFEFLIFCANSSQNSPAISELPRALFNNNSVRINHFKKFPATSKSSGIGARKICISCDHHWDFQIFLDSSGIFQKSSVNNRSKLSYAPAELNWT
jgi:hypothetical protein